MHKLNKNVREIKNALHRARCRAFYETKLFVVCGREQDPVVVQILSCAGGELLQQILHGHATALLSADVQHDAAGIHHQRAIAQLQCLMHIVRDHQIGRAHV